MECGKVEREKVIAVLKYMDLRIKGFGAGLTKKEIEILNQTSDREWKGIRQAIIELGGTVPEIPEEIWRIA